MSEGYEPVFIMEWSYGVPKSSEVVGIDYLGDYEYGFHTNDTWYIFVNGVATETQEPIERFFYLPQFGGEE